MTEPRAAVLAIDGGNSKTDVALVDRDGQLMGSASGPGSNAQQIGLEEALNVLDRLVAEAVGLAGIPARATGTPEIAERTIACLAGADLPEEEESLNAAVRTRGWSLTTRVANDTFAVLRAGAPAGWGVAVTCGAGINCVGVAADGRVARYPALGRLSGDWGGSGDLAPDVLWWAARSEDGRGPKTALAASVARHFDTPTATDVCLKIHRGLISPDHLHGLTYVLFETAALGDAVARDLVEGMADEIVTMATTLMKRLELLDAPVDVVLGGGLLRARDPILMAKLAASMTMEAPKAVLHILDRPPIVGAVMLGLDEMPGGAAAARRFRDVVTPAVQPTVASA